MRHAHKAVASIAVEIANDVYEAKCSRDNDFYRLHPNRADWVRRWSHIFIPDARAQLTDMLVSDKYDEATKDRLMDILVADQSIPRKGQTLTQR